MSCEICCEEFNKSTRKSIQCGSCELKACRACVLQFIRETPAAVRCMGCSNLWSRQFLSSVMTKSFMSREFKEHRELILFDQQKAQMEATLPFVECVKRKRSKMQEVQDLYDHLDETHRKIRRINREIESENQFLNRTSSSSSSTDEEKPRLFSRGHCVEEDCNGLIDNTWKCSTCETPVCNRCMEKRETGHLCRPENVESMRSIRADSKPCPSCGVRIHIYTGCNQAWCTQCNTAFNWRTMKLITRGFFHNPHYAEWQVANGGSGDPVSNFRQGTPAPCVNFHDIHRRVTEENPDACRLEQGSIERDMRGYLIAANHIMDMNTDPRTEETVVKMRMLRVSYLMNEISEDEFKVSSQRVDKAASKRAELSAVFEMYGTVARDILARWARNKEISMEECKKTLRDLYEYTRDSVRNIHHYYQPFTRHTGAFMNNVYTHIS